MVQIRQNQIRRVFSTTGIGVAIAPLVLTAVALFHSVLFVWLVPLWQTPDEPTQFQYAALIVENGRIPGADDADTSLEERVVASMVQHRFFEYLLGRSVVPAPRTFADVRQTFFMPDQIGNDPPLYFLVASAPLALLWSESVDIQVINLRLMGSLFVVGTVLCIYGAANELQLGDQVALIAGLLAALQPMVVFVGIGVGNDGLANFIGATICWLLIRITRCGANLYRILLLVGLLLMGVLTKRTLFPVAAFVGLLAVIWAVGWLLRKPFALRTRLALLAGSLLGCTLAIWLLIMSSRGLDTAAYWSGKTADQAVTRVLDAPHSKLPALQLNTGEVAVQALPDVVAEWAQNRNVYVTAHVWTSTDIARGHITIDYGWSQVEQPFEVQNNKRTVQVQALLPLYAPYLHITLRSDEGVIYADQVSAESDRRRGMNLLLNGDFASAGLRQDTLPALVQRLFPFATFRWLWQSGRLLEPPPLEWELPRIFFVSFWGQFGWMTVPLVGATWWEGALAVICLGGLLGSLRFLVAPDQPFWRRRAVLLLILLIIVGTLFPMANAYIQPRSQAIQQGRYLFTALGPIILLIVVGWRTLIPSGWHTGAALIGAAFGICFAGAALRLIASVY